MFRKLPLLIVLLVAATNFWPHGLFGAENAERQALTPRLVEQITGLLKGGAHPKVWVMVFGRRVNVEVSAADAKAISVLVQKNALPLAWDKLSDEELLGVAKSVSGDTGAGWLLAGDVALALKQNEQAAELLAKATVADPALAQKVAAFSSKLQAAGPPAGTKPTPAPPDKTATPAAPDKAAPDARNAILTRLPMGWWKDYHAPDVPLGKIHPGHPRLFLREKAFGEGGLTLDELRRRGSQDPWKGWVPRFTKDITNNAMKYLLNGDKAAADEAVKQLLNPPKLGADTDDGDELERQCMAYDWLCGYPGFSADQKKKAADLIAGVADVLERV